MDIMGWGFARNMMILYWSVVDVWRSWRKGEVSDIIDQTLKSGSSSIDDIIKVIHIGLLCVQESVVDRPTMASIIHMLDSFSIVLPEPAEPAYFRPNNIYPEMSLLQEYGSSSGSNSKSRLSQNTVNEASISDFAPR
ncbi:putative non-specific serine/threonine protein kinase [Helianthus debilis subsp. tardiflorus]